MKAALSPAPAPRQFGAVNWRGMWSIVRRDLVRFFRYGAETIGGPVVSSLMFLAVFQLAFDGMGEVVPGVPLAQFVAPGIVMFSLTLNAFQAAAVSIFHDKLEGIIGDFLSAPLSPLEIIVALTLSAAGAALVTASVIVVLFALFIDMPVYAPFAVLGFAVGAALVFALLGAIVGICAERWEHFSAAETFLVFPIGLLSGAFFAVAKFPDGVRWIFAANPVFHALEGFRYGFTGYAAESLTLAAIVLMVLIAVLGIVAWRLFAAGYKIKP